MDIQSNSIVPDDLESFVHNIKSSPNDNRPRLLLLGLNRSGKSSIQQIVFDQVSPHETVFLATTNEITKYEYPGLSPEIASSSLFNIQVLDFPSPEKLHYKSYAPYVKALLQFKISIIFVVDSSVEEISPEVLDHINSVSNIVSGSTDARLDVFIHKLDPDVGRSRGERLYLDWEKHIINVVARDSCKFFATSMLDLSLLEACSQIIQRLTPNVPAIQHLVESLVGACSLEVAMLLDIFSKLYIAANPTMVETQTYEMISSFVDIAVDSSYIYEAKERSKLHQSETVDDTTGLIRLSNGSVFYFKQISATLVLVASMNSRILNKRGILEYNIRQFKSAIEDYTKKNSREFLNI